MVEQDLGFGYSYDDTAATHGRRLSLKKGIPPAGYAAYWDESFYAGAGHVATSRGDGTFVSTHAGGISDHWGAGWLDHPGYMGFAPRGLKSGVADWSIFADGGILTEEVRGVGMQTGRKYQLGEAGHEAVIPLNRTGPSGMVPIPRASGMRDNTGGGDTINVYVAGSVTAANDLVDTIHNGLLKKQNRVGPLGWK